MSGSLGYKDVSAENVDDDILTHPKKVMQQGEEASYLIVKSRANNFRRFEEFYVYLLVAPFKETVKPNIDVPHPLVFLSCNKLVF